MATNEPTLDLTDLVDGLLSGPEWEAWRAANPDAATEVEIARRSRIMVEQLRAMPIALPPDFEARLLARCQEDRSLLDLLDLGLAKGGRLLLDLLDLFFAFLPMPQPRADSAARAG